MTPPQLNQFVQDECHAAASLLTWRVETRNQDMKVSFLAALQKFMLAPTLL